MFFAFRVICCIIFRALFISLLTNHKKNSIHTCSVGPVSKLAAQNRGVRGKVHLGVQLDSQQLGSLIITSCESHQRKNKTTESSESQTPPFIFQMALCLSVLQFVTSGSFPYTWCIFEKKGDNRVFHSRPAFWRY